MDFTHLHLHTEYSLLDGANRLNDLCETLIAQGVKSVAITDHGNMHGAIDFYKTMKKAGIKPIIGIETYIHNSDDITDKSSRQRFHLILLAKNEIGYQNLMYLSSRAFIDGFYYNPRINKKLLREHSEGLVCSAACLQGEVNFHLNLSERNISRGAKGYETAKAAALEYREIFGDDFYLEIMRHGIKDQMGIDKQILRLAKETGIKLIATNDAHYIRPQMASAHDIYMCIAMNKTINDASRMHHKIDQLYVKSPQEMCEIFADIPEAIANTQEIVNKCNLELNLGNPTPPNFKFALEQASNLGISLPNPQNECDLQNDSVLFEHVCRAGLKERLKFIDESKHEIYYARLEREIDIIKNMKFPGYMLIVADFINWAKNHDIPVGPGRGSAAGSLGAYSMKITDIDPIPYNLLFERFLNPERVSMPDIDVDFCQNRRGLVIDYVIEKYGKFNVAQVATFGKLLAKGVIRDVARVCDMSYQEADKMAKLIPDELKITLKDAYAKEPKIAELINSNSLAKQIWEFALDLEGLNRNAGMHAAGVVISNEELWKKAPLFRQSNAEDGHYVTQYTKDYLEDVDLIKFDFLGLKTLDVIDSAKKLIKMRYDKEILWEQINVNEPAVYKTIQSGETLGIFQIEGAGMQDLASNLKPDCLEDIIAMISLYRPGPMDEIPNFISRKHGLTPIVYAFDEIKEILEPTYGLIVYQEQVMQIVQKIGGFSLGGADIVRRAMSKKKESEMKKIRIEYLDGAQKNGFDREKADRLFDEIATFASYGFNKSHAAAYSMITFQTAYLKTFYPAEFMAALLTSEEDNTDKVAKYIHEIRRLGIEILPPSLNSSIREFGVVKKDGKDAIIFGFGAIKGVGLSAIENIVKERESSGEYKNLEDFISRVDNFKVNKKVIEALIKSGAMDDLGHTRLELSQNIDNIIDALKDMATARKENFLFEECEATNIEIKFSKTGDEFDQKELLQMEKDFLGIYISGHPLDKFRDKIATFDYISSSKFGEISGAMETILIGKIEDFSTRITKTGKKMGILNVLDLDGTFELVVFDSLAERISNFSDSEKEKPYVFRVKILADDGLKISLLDISDLQYANSDDFAKKIYKKRNGGANNFSNNFNQTPARKIEEFKITLNVNELNEEKINKIYQIAYNQSKNQSNYKKLILIINLDELSCKITTTFFIDDNFSQEVEKIIKIA